MAQKGKGIAEVGQPALEDQVFPLYQRGQFFEDKSELGIAVFICLLPETLNVTGGRRHLARIF